MLAVQLFGRDCGCDARKEVIFGTGGFGVTEMVILGGGIALLALAWKGKSA